MRIPFSAYDFFGYLAAGFIVLVSIDFVTGSRLLLMDSLPPIAALFWALVAFVVGHLIAHLASILLENVLLRKFLRSPEVHVFGTSEKSWRSRLFPAHYRPLPAELQKRIQERAAEYDAPPTGRALFLHCHAVVKHQSTTIDRLNTFLVQYGFCRNMSMAFASAALVLIFGCLVSPSTPVATLLWVLLALVLSAGMFIRYLKFFRHYTVEVFTSYAETPAPPSRAPKE